MTEDWDFYFCNVDDKLASMFVDLGALDMLPIKTHSLMAYVSVKMNVPRDDGLSSNDEYDQLVAIEDALEKLCVDGKVVYVGRCTSDGLRDFYFYIGSEVVWHDRVEACMRSFPSYQYRIGSRADPDWYTYRSYLYPSDTNLQSIQNRRVCDTLERNGDDLSVARDIDHWAEFPDPAARDLFIAEARKLGFTVRALTTSEEDGKFSAQVCRRDIPSRNGIDEVTLPLHRLALEYGGEYDGWETVVLRSGPGPDAGPAADTGLGARFKKMFRTLTGSSSKD